MGGKPGGEGGSRSLCGPRCGGLVSGSCGALTPGGAEAGRLLDER